MSNSKNSLGNESDTLRDQALAAFDDGVENPDKPIPIKADKVEDAGALDDDDQNEVGETDEERAEREKAEKAAADLEAGKTKETGKPAKADKPNAVPAVSKGKPADGEETPEQIAAKEKAKAETDAEIAVLGLRGKSAERFRELVDYKRDTAPVIEALGGREYLTEIGITSKQDLENLVFDGQSARDWDKQLAEVGALPEQVGQAFGAIAGFNKGLAQFQTTGETTIMEQYIANLQGEIDNAAKIIGKPAGKYDPLQDDANKDLRERVESGDLSPKDASELIRLRVIERERAAGQQRQTQTQQRTQAENAQVADAVKDIGKLGAELRAIDGDELFAYRMQRMGPKLEEIKSKYPPTVWAAKAEAAYLRITPPVKATPAAKPRVGQRTNVVRTDPALGSQVERQAIDPIDAFDIGVAEMREQGR